MLVRAVGRLLGGHLTGYVLAGMLISVGAFFGALLYLYGFARDALGEESARASLWLLASYPFAVFFSALYTESLFLLGALGAFYHFSRHQFGRAALWGLLVGLTRLNGALLVIPLLVLATRPRSPCAFSRAGAGGGVGGRYRPGDLRAVHLAHDRRSAGVLRRAGRLGAELSRARRARPSAVLGPGARQG